VAEADAARRGEALAQAAAEREVLHTEVARLQRSLEAIVSQRARQLGHAQASPSEGGAGQGC
jgi:hypothetical protein